MLSIFGFIITTSLLIFIHEFGHYYVAKKLGVKIEEFSIGFGKELFFRIDKDDVRWKICALPLGGYVKIYGFDPSKIENIKINDKDRAFINKSLIAQFLIVIAGPVANYLLAIFIFANIYFFYGKVEIPAIIDKVIADSPAEDAGLMENDKIIMVDNNEINNFADLQQNILVHANKSINFLVERNEEIITIPIIPKEITETNSDESKVTRIYVGIIAKNKPIYLNMNIFQSIYQGLIDVISISNLILKTFGQMLTGARSLDGINGPLTIAKESSKSLAQGPLNFVVFIAMISINLGLINLLPIPVLDGGHLLFITYQAIFGKSLSQPIKNVIMRIGVGIIIFLIVISISNDIRSLIF